MPYTCLGQSNVPGSGSGVAGDDAGLLTAVYTTGDLAANAPTQLQRQAQGREPMPNRTKAASKLDNSSSGVTGAGRSGRRKANLTDPWNINGK